MARITGTKNVTNNSFQTVQSTGSVVISAGNANNSGTVFVNAAGTGSNLIFNAKDGQISLTGQNVNINALSTNTTTFSILNLGGKATFAFVTPFAPVSVAQSVADFQRII